MHPDKVKILQELKEKLALQLNDNLKKVVLFGSQLTDNKTKSYSDYDILIVVNKKNDWKLVSCQA